MSSKIPRLLSPPGVAKTDDEKLAQSFKGARPKQTAAGKSSDNIKINKNLDPSKKKCIKVDSSKGMKNKNELPSGITIPKTTINKTNKNIGDFSKEENVKKCCVPENENIKTMKLSENKISYGSCKENNQKNLPVKNKKSENYRKTLFNYSKTPNELDKDSEFSGLILIPKVRHSYKSLDLSKNRRRSLSEPNIKPGKLSEKGKCKIIDSQILHKNKSKSINRRELDVTFIMSPEVTDSMKSNLAQNNVDQDEFLASTKDVAHGGLKFLPNLKKKKSGFIFTVNKT